MTGSQSTDYLLKASAFDVDAYHAAIQPRLAEFESFPTESNAALLSQSMIHGAMKQLGTSGLLLVGSSTGKDSTLLSLLVAQVLEQRTDSLEPTPEVLIAIADTMAEFPEMADRINSECRLINKWGENSGLPIRCIVKRPMGHHRLLAEVIGNGKPLPKLASGKARHGLEPGNWCMDRVKKEPIDQIRALANQERMKRPFLHLLGTRYEESSKRAGTMTRMASGLPFGLTWINDGSNTYLGLSPIAHWKNEWLRSFLHKEIVPWDIYSVERLRNIYEKGAASVSGLGMSECAIRQSEDGGLTSVCSDLSGVRMGCWCCLKSQNRSLRNFASRDKRYRWLRVAHLYMINSHDASARRRRLLRQCGFSEKTLFPKNHTFRWRYVLAMIVARAEMESGFTLITKEEASAINAFWEKSGVWGVTLDHAYSDARRWMQTGKFRLFWEEINADDSLSAVLGCGIPTGAFFHILHTKLDADQKGNTQSLNLVNLLPLVELGDELFPRMQAYIFRKRDGSLVVMLSDTASTLGLRTNTGLLNGMCAINWHFVGVRPPTRWEMAISSGRNIFYQISKETISIAVTNACNDFHLTCIASAGVAGNCGGSSRDIYAEYLHSSSAFAEDYRRLSTKDALRGRIENALIRASLSGEAIEEGFRDVRAKIRSKLTDAAEGWALVEDTGAKGKAFRGSIRLTLKEELCLRELAVVFDEWRNAIQDLLREVQSGEISIKSLPRYAYLLRLRIIDPLEFESTIRRTINTAEIHGGLPQVS